MRRVITGHNDKGKSIVWYDGPPVEFEGLYEMWMTDQIPANNTYTGDAAERIARLEPPPKGSILLFFKLQPEDLTLSREERERRAATGFAAMDASHCRIDTSRHPRMHQTRTVDYVVLLEGEVTLLLDEVEVDLKPFDVVIQRGTNHVWINKGSQPALLAVVLIDAKPVHEVKSNM